jgi:hypothetical protein
MRSSDTITLFSRPPQRDSGPTAFVVSIVLHGGLFALLFATLTHVRVVEPRMLNQKYAVRLLDMRHEESSLQWSPQHITRRGQAARRAVSAGGSSGTARISQMARLSRNFLSQKPAPQTLIQPEVPPEQRELAQIPIPQVMVWTPDEITRRKIVTPAPQPAGAIEAKPSLAAPNHELNPADVSLSSTPYSTQAPLPAPSTTSPVEMIAPEPAQQLPETASQDAEQMSPARVISLSDLKLQEGTAALPVVNEVAPSDASGAPATAQAESIASKAGDGGTEGLGKGAGVAQGAGSSGEKPDGFTVEDGSNAAAGGGFSIDMGSGADPAPGSPSIEHLTMPKDGHYQMVVVGASPQEDYPQTANLWTDRMVYTVYLQTDTAQNWILQYALLRQLGDDPGDGSRPDPPWPYDMMRPNLGAENDIVLVHGFVNTDGRFEQLTVAYPPRFPQTDLLLRALRQWTFRPAMSQGQPATVEVLLIIPAATD